MGEGSVVVGRTPQPRGEAMRVLLRLIDAEGRKWYAIGELEDTVVKVGDPDTKGKLDDMVAVYDLLVVIDGE